MANIPGMYVGYWIIGSTEINGQVMISSRNKVHAARQWVGIGPLPGII